jgi:hypothetical protein
MRRVITIPKEDGHEFCPIPTIDLSYLKIIEKQKSILVVCKKCNLIAVQDYNDHSFIVYIGSDYDNCDNFLIKDILT